MIQIKIINKIKEQVELYQEKTGASKVWIAKQLDISKQRLYQLFEAEEITATNLIKLMVLLDCKFEDLIEYETIEFVK